MRFTLIVFLALLISENVSSKNLSFQGRVFDYKTNEPIAYTSIAVSGTFFGTVSNTTGDFRLIIPDKLSGSSISFSAIGYESYTMPINNISDRVIVHLKKYDYQIGEIIVMPDSSLQALLRKAYNRIPENYPDYPTQNIGFYRESLRHDGGDYLNLSEAILDVYKTTYKNESKGQVKIIKSRKNKISGSDTINYVRFYGGLFTAHSSDIVKNRNEILRPSVDYSYKLEGIENFKGREVYCISFHPKKIKKKGRIGKFYIDKESLAYVKFDFRSNNEALKWMEEDQPLTFLSSKEERFIRYYENINDKYYLRSAFFSGKIFNKKTNYMLELTEEYVTTDIITEGVEQIPYSEQVSYTTVIADVAEDYHVSDWRDYSILEVDSMSNTLLSSKEAEGVLARVNPPSKGEKMEKLFKFISRFESEISMVAYPVSVSSGDYALQLSLPSGNRIDYQFNSVDESFSFQYEMAIKYKLTRNWKLFFNAGENILSSERSSCNNFGIEYSIPLKTYGRRIFYSVNAGYGFLEFMKTMGTANNMSEFSFGRKRFDSKEIEAFRGIKTNGIRLGSDLSFQISNLWYIRLFGGWQFNFNQTEKIRLKEKEGFFIGLNSAEENLQSEGIDFLYNGEKVSYTQFNFQNYFLGLGLKWSF